jgi:hypothetical protein
MHIEMTIDRDRRRIVATLSGEIELAGMTRTVDAAVRHPDFVLPGSLSRVTTYRHRWVFRDDRAHRRFIPARGGRPRGGCGRGDP